MAAPQQDRWQPRPVLAGLLRLTLVSVPLVFSGAAVVLVARALPPGVGRTWWGLLLLFAVTLVTGTLVERLARRWLPLAVLLRMTLLFPDRAPSRLRLVRTATARSANANRPLADDTSRTVADAVQDLVVLLGTHDRRTRGHSERVRVLADMLAVEQGFDRDVRDRLRWAALLHDIGKIEVPTRILNKPASLDRAEFDVIRQHPAHGAALAAPLLPWLGEQGRGIVEHHERYDGTGYPAGLSGHEISAAGRLIAVVDAFETMTATRPYKTAVATRTARAELARCAGSHFDPHFVRGFLELSLPRVLWAMGPVAFFLQLPFLRSLAEAGARTSVATGQAATGAASAAALAGAGVAVAGAALGGVVTHGTDWVSTPVFAQTVALDAASGPDAAGQADAPTPTAASVEDNAVRSRTLATPAPTVTSSPGASAQAGATAPTAPFSTTAPASTARTAGSTRPAGSSARQPVAVPTPRVGSAPARPTSSRDDPAQPTSPDRSGTSTEQDPRRTTLTRHPDERTTHRSATFVMSSSAGSKFQCRLQRPSDDKDDERDDHDRDEDKGGWRHCTSSITYNDLGLGKHTFRVRSIDATGRKGKQTRFSWQIIHD